MSIAAAAAAPVRASMGRQVWLLARRSILGTLRSPGAILPTLAVPLLLFFVISSGLSAAEKIKGFPTDNFTTFALTIAFANGALVTIANTGQATATDIESGFMDRLAMTPMRGFAFLGAQLAGVFLLGIVQAALFIGVGLAAGARPESGVLGVAVLIVMFLLAVLGFGAAGMLIGLRTGSGEAVQAIAPLMTVFLFLSSINMPRNLMEHEWFVWIATANPLTYLVEGLRSLLISDWNTQAVVLGFIVAALIFAAALTLSGMSLRTRLIST